MSQVSHAALYGSGVFTTIRIVNGEPWLWDKHWRRLMHDSAAIGIDKSALSEDALRQELIEKISSKALVSGKARITISDERSSPLWSDTRGDAPASVWILAAPLRELPTRFRIGVSQSPVNSGAPIAGLKTTNYLEPLLLLRQAMDSDFNEAVRLNERGHVTSGCMANVFWLADGQLYTPALSTGSLPGTTREFVCEKMDVKDVEADIAELKNAEAIFLTSAGLGVIAVDEFDGREMPKRDHEILQIAFQGQLPRMHE